jgi:hypothetical protein
MVKVMLLAVAVMAIAFVGLAVKILFKKGGRFPNTHISGNKYLRAKGVTCIQTYDKLEQSRGKKVFSFKGLKLGHAVNKDSNNLFIYGRHSNL